MFKRIFLGLVVVGIWSLSVFAQDKEEILSLVYERPYPDQEKARALREEVEYQPLFLVEGEFSQEEVKTLGMKTKIKGKKQSISMCYPKVILLKKGEQGIGKSPETELLFLDKFGKVGKRYLIDSEDVFWSENNKYLCVYKDKKIIVLDAEGKELWSYKYSPIAGIEVSPSGDYVIEEPDVDWGGYGEMILRYQNNGYKKIDLNCILPFYIDFSEDGEYFCVTSGLHLILFDKYGKELWKKEEGFGREYPYFLKNKFIGAMANTVVGDEDITYFYLYDINGNLLWKNKVFLSVQDICYLEEEGRIYVLSDWGHFFCFDVKSGELLAKYSDKHAPTFFPSWKAVSSGKQKTPSDHFLSNWRGIFVKPDHSKVFTFAFPKGKPNRLDSFDKNLKEMEQNELHIKDIKYSPQLNLIVKFSKDNLLSIMTKEGLKTYEVK